MRENKLNSHCREMLETSNVIDFQVCLQGHKRSRQHVSGHCCHTTETLQIHTWMGCFKPSLFAGTGDAHTSVYPHGYVERSVGMAKIPIHVGNSSVFDQCCLSVDSFWFLSDFFLHSHLEYNSLREVNSGSLYGLSSLHQLHLSNNSISRINPDGWSFCQKLHEL